MSPASEKRVTLDLADDYYQIAEEARYRRSKPEIGKTTDTHTDVETWHYFVDDILFQEYGKEETVPYTVGIDVKERPDGGFVYTYHAERSEKYYDEQDTRRTLHADVTPTNDDGSNAPLVDTSISDVEGKSNTQNVGIESRFSDLTAADRARTDRTIALKEYQLGVIQRSHPADSDTQAWARDISDIMTFREAMREESYTPDYTEEDAREEPSNSAKTGVTVQDGVTSGPENSSINSVSDSTEESNTQNLPQTNRPDLTEGDRRRTATRRTAEELYRDTAGEIEARDAASRRRMNDDWRKNTRPDIDREDVVFAGDAGEGLYIGRTAGKRQFVKVEKDVLKGVPKDKWRSKICRVVEKLFPKGLEIGNNLINIDHDSKRELTYSEYSKYMYNNDPGIFGDKMRALNNADEIIKATQNWISEGLKHPRKDDIVDFARGSVLMQIGGRKYYAEVVVGTRKMVKCCCMTLLA